MNTQITDATAEIAQEISIRPAFLQAGKSGETCHVKIIGPVNPQELRLIRDRLDDAGFSALKDGWNWVRKGTAENVRLREVNKERAALEKWGLEAAVPAGGIGAWQVYSPSEDSYTDVSEAYVRTFFPDVHAAEMRLCESL